METISKIVNDLEIVEEMLIIAGYSSSTMLNCSQIHLNPKIYNRTVYKKLISFLQTNRTYISLNPKNVAAIRKWPIPYFINKYVGEELSEILASGCSGVVAVLAKVAEETFVRRRVPSFLDDDGLTPFAMSSVVGARLSSGDVSFNKHSVLINCPEISGHREDKKASELPTTRASGEFHGPVEVLQATVPGTSLSCSCNCFLDTGFPCPLISKALDECGVDAEERIPAQWKNVSLKALYGVQLEFGGEGKNSNSGEHEGTTMSGRSLLKMLDVYVRSRWTDPERFSMAVYKWLGQIRREKTPNKSEKISADEMMDADGDPSEEKSMSL